MSREQGKDGRRAGNLRSPLSRSPFPGESGPPAGNGGATAGVGARCREVGLLAPPGRQAADAPILSLEFFQELESARRRVAVLEEANRATQDSLRRIARLSEFSEGLDRSHSVEDVSELLFGEIRGILPAKVLMLAVVDRGGLEFQLVRVAPRSAEARAREELSAQIASGVFGWTIEFRRPAMVVAGHLGGNLVLVPLSTARRTVGMLMVLTQAAAEAVEQQQVTLAAVVARQAAESLDNLWLTEDVRRQNEAIQQAAEAALARRVADLGLLVEAARTVGTLDQDAALRFLVEVVCRHLEVRIVSISVRDAEERLPVVVSAGLSARFLEGPAVRLGDGSVVAAVAAQRAPLFVPDLQADPRTKEPGAIRAEGLVSFLGVPLLAHDQVIGVLSVLTDSPREFTADESALLTGLAAQGALAIENARLFADVHRRMGEQQRALCRLVQSARLASVGLLAGGVAHDINNPLCIISNHLQLLRLREDRLDPVVEGRLNAIEASVHRIARSIEALLDYARGRPGERQPADINEAVERIRFLLQYHPLCRRLQVVTDFTPDLPRVALDRSAWDQVMLELLTNAREAMPEGGAVRVITRQVRRGEWGEAAAAQAGGALPAGGAGGASEPHTGPLRPRVWLQVIVEDNGPGIPPQDLPRVYDPFFTTKAPDRSMGMGLGMCRDIIAQHGGRLWLESDGRSGTRVIIELPAADDETSPARTGACTGSD